MFKEQKYQKMKIIFLSYMHLINIHCVNYEVIDFAS